ncbi:MAG: hypothetical protein ACI9V8_002188, partial [Urechidicola sp.]
VSFKCSPIFSTDFIDFDYLLAMDESNYSGMQRL